MSDSARRASSSTPAPNDPALIVGLPNLAYSTLPAGAREIRLVLVCNVCSPERMLRILDLPARGGRRTEAEVFTNPISGVDRISDPEARGRLEAMADSIAAAVACGPWRPGAISYGPDTYRWCRPNGPGRAGRVRLLSRLDCQDLGGRHLLIEVLEPDRFRQAQYGRLEGRPLGDERTLASEVLDMLTDVLDPSRE